jgi:hypothetical protein
MKRIIGIILASIFLASAAQAADCIVTCSWDGLQANGQPELSTPVQIIIFDADTQDTLTQASVTGAVTDLQLPSFSLVPPDNEVLVVHIAAKAVDSAGNVSAPSEVKTITLTGNDTVPPGTVIININLN